MTSDTHCACSTPLVMRSPAAPLPPEPHPRVARLMISHICPASHTSSSLGRAGRGWCGSWMPWSTPRALSAWVPQITSLPPVTSPT
ncbi:rCG57260, partial [Rattus norvegicus]